MLLGLLVCFGILGRNKYFGDLLLPLSGIASQVTYGIQQLSDEGANGYALEYEVFSWIFVGTVSKFLTR